MTIKVNNTKVIDVNRNADLTELTVNGPAQINFVSQNNTIEVVPTSTSVISVDASLGNNFSTIAAGGTTFGVIYTASYADTYNSISEVFNPTIFELPQYLKQGDILRIALVNNDNSVVPRYRDNNNNLYNSSIVIRADTANNHYSYLEQIVIGATPITSFQLEPNSTDSFSYNMVVFVTRNEVSNYSVSGNTFNGTSQAITLTPLSVTNASTGVVLIYGFTNSSISTSNIIAISDSFRTITKSISTNGNIFVGYRIVPFTQTITPSSFRGTLGTGVWSARTDSRQTTATGNNPSLVFSNVPTLYFCTIEINYYSGQISWPANTKWDNGVAPLFQEFTKNLIFFRTKNGGSSWEATWVGGYPI